MLSLLAMTLAGDWWWGALIGKTVIVVFTPLCAAAIYAAGHRFLSTTAGLVGALVYLSTPWIFSVSTSGLVEGASACYLFLALYALLLARHAGRVERSEPWPSAGKVFSPAPAWRNPPNATALVIVSG